VRVVASVMAAVWELARPGGSPFPRGRPVGPWLGSTSWADRRAAGARSKRARGQGQDHCAEDDYAKFDRRRSGRGLRVGPVLHGLSGSVGPVPSSTGETRTLLRRAALV